jgi:hypothetical protein
VTAQARRIAPFQWDNGTAWYRNVTIELEAPAGFWFLPNQQVGPQAIAASPTDFVLAHSGTEQGYLATITIEGPITNPRLTNLTNGVYVEYLGALAGGETVVLTGELKNAFKGATNVIANVRHSGSIQWMIFEPGNNSLRLTGTGIGAGAKVTIVFKPPYL